MHQDDHPARKAVAPREARQDNAVVDDRQGRQITPTDGSVAGSGAMVCVFCAPCQRWIDCYDGIPPRSPISDTGCCSTDLDYPVVI